MPFCPKCGKEVSEGFMFCPGCGQRLKVGVTAENTSGQGKLAIVPEEVKGWSWGAFSLNWIWGLAWAIVLGIKGSEWAWRNKKWDSIEHFESTQRIWNIAGIVVFAMSIVTGIAIAVIIFAVVIPLALRCSA